MKRRHAQRPSLLGIWSILAVAVMALLLIGCSSSPSGDGPGATSGVTVGPGSSAAGGGAASGAVKVIAAENFWGSIAAQVGRSRVAVTSIISDPSADPHLYSSSAQNAAAIAQADVVIVNGAGYDDFMDRLMAASPNANRVVVSAEQVLGLSGSDVNPHLWYDLPRVPEVAKAIEQALTAQAPSYAKEFAANRVTFESSLKPVLATIATIREKYAGTPVAYTERVTGYLLEAAGLSVMTPPGFAGAVEEGNEPSPVDAATMAALLTGKQVKLLLYNSQATSPITLRVQNLAKDALIPVVAVTETLPPEYPTYQAWQLAQVQSILQALGG